MAILLKTAGVLVASGIAILTAGYLFDTHRCKQLNYEQAGYVVPRTFVISVKQCLDMAGNLRLRGYAKGTEDLKPAAGDQ